MSIKLKLEGFDNLFSQITKAGGTVDAAAKACLNKSARIMQSELKAQMQSAGVPGNLINRMPPPEVEAEGNRYTARVGYKKGAYDPRNPSDGYEIVFLNYGTPKRTMHGKVKARGFIQKAKKKASPQIKRAQQETLNEIIRGLNG